MLVSLMVDSIFMTNKVPGLRKTALSGVNKTDQERAGKNLILGLISFLLTNGLLFCETVHLRAPPIRVYPATFLPYLVKDQHHFPVQGEESLFLTGIEPVFSPRKGDILGR